MTMQVTLSIITNPLLITSCRVCGWNAKMIFVHSKHIFLVQNISEEEQKNPIFLLKVLKSLFSVRYYYVSIDEQKFTRPMFYFPYQKQNKYSQLLFTLFLKKSESVSHSVMSDSSRPHGLQPARLLCPWNSPGKNTSVGSHSLLQGIFPTQGSNLGLLHCGQILYHLSHQVHSLLETKQVFLFLLCIQSILSLLLFRIIS